MAVDPLDDFSIERYGFLGWRVLYKGVSWRKDYSNTLPLHGESYTIPRDTERKLRQQKLKLLELQTQALERDVDIVAKGDKHTPDTRFVG